MNEEELKSNYHKYNIRPYIVKDSGKSIKDVFDNVNYNAYYGHGPDYSSRNNQLGVMADSLVQYEKLLIALTDNKNISCLPFCEILVDQFPDNEVRCGIRHDVDLDIRTAVEQAKLENKHGIRTTYYILHTAPYYGEFINKVFYRNESMINVYEEIQDLGHEIALHTDALKVYQDYKIDGADSLVTEITWLRENGINLVGTTAHNSASVYGAENYAIFKGKNRSLFLSLPSETNSKTVVSPDEVIFNGKWAPLQVLDENKLGLSYESNEVFWQKDIPIAYGALRGPNIWRWNTHILNWKKLKIKHERWFYDQDRLLKDIKKLNSKQYLILVLHPIYSGMRHSPVSGPLTVPLNKSECIVNDDIGWETYKPLSIVAKSKSYEGDVEFQSINLSNKDGIQDTPNNAIGTNYTKVLMLGSTNLEGATIALTEQFSEIFSDLANKHYKSGMAIWKYAYFEMGLNRHFAWFEKLKDSINPDFVVIGIGANEPELSIPTIWSDKTGYSRTHPPGDYIDYHDKGVRIIKQSRSSKIRRKKKVSSERYSLLSNKDGSIAGYNNHAKYIEKCLEFYILKIKEIGAQPILMIQELGESAGLWNSNIPVEIRVKSHESFINWVSKIGEPHNVPIIDPYKEFIDENIDLSMHWNSIFEWNYTGHRVAAETLFDAFVNNPLLASTK